MIPRPIPKCKALHPVSPSCCIEHFLIPPGLLLQIYFTGITPVIWNIPGALCRHTATFCKEERLVIFIHSFFDTSQLVFPISFRIITAGGNHIHRIPPGHIFLLIFISIIRNRSMIYGTQISNQFAPLRISSLSHNHFAPGNKHFTSCTFSNFCKIHLECRVCFKPIAPLWLTGHFIIKEIDKRTPYAIAAVYRWFQTYSGTFCMNILNHANKFRFTQRFFSKIINRLRLWCILHTHWNQDNEISSCSFQQIVHTAIRFLLLKTSSWCKGTICNTFDIIHFLHFPRPLGLLKTGRLISDLHPSIYFLPALSYLQKSCRRFSPKGLDRGIPM